MLAAAFGRLCVVGVVVVVAGCAKPEAYVECKANGPTLAAGFGCTVDHRSGGAVRACWTLSVTCANGPVGFAEACGDVEPKAKTAIGVPFSAFGGALDKCDQVSGMKVTTKPTKSL